MTSPTWRSIAALLPRSVGRANADRRRELEIERPLLKSLPPRRTTDFEEDLITVTRSGGFLLRRVFYTVPSRLIGHRLRVRIYDDRIECFLGGEPVLTLPRGRPPQGRAMRSRTVHVVDYRHVIHALRRKPHALLNLVYRDQLFPRAAFRNTWDALIAAEPPRIACRIMVRLLALAHERGCEAELATELEAVLGCGNLPDLDALEARFAPSAASSPQVTVTLPPPVTYDALLSSDGHGALGMSTITVDTARLPLLLHELRLPAVSRLWQDIAARADKEGWPAVRFLSALAELELAERARRRVERHLAEARMPPGKTLDTFDFNAVPMLSKAHVMALASGDTWLAKGANLLLFGPPGSGKSHVAAALGRALIENGYRVLFMRTTDIVQRLQAERQALQLAAAITKLGRFDLVRDPCHDPR